MNNTQRLASIDTLLQGVGRFQCVEGCHDCCGPVPMTRLERRRIVQQVGQFESSDQHLNCGLLKDGRCSVYDIRPAICRVFGASEHHRLTCPHGRQPEKLLTADQTDEMIDTIEQLGHGMVFARGATLRQVAHELSNLR